MGDHTEVTARARVLRRLHDLHERERALLPEIRAQLAATPPGGYHDQLEAHLGETQAHIRALADRLAELGYRNGSLLSGVVSARPVGRRARERAPPHPARPAAPERPRGARPPARAARGRRARREHRRLPRARPPRARGRRQRDADARGPARRAGAGTLRRHHRRDPRAHRRALSSFTGALPSRAPAAVMLART